MVVYGTRPEAIKVAPVIRALQQDIRFNVIAVSTGQHREMLEQVNSKFGIQPKHDLEIMRDGQSLNGIISRVIEGLDRVIDAELPELLLVHGDTSTAMAAALTAFNSRIPIGHIEAGLRSGSLFSPFPEEANRRVISQLASLHLAPTEHARENLLSSGVSEKCVHVTGNTVIDALLEATTWKTEFSDSRLNALSTAQQRVVLVTTHRRENLAEMASIGRALQSIAKANPDVCLVLPAHLNPRVRDAILPQIANVPNTIITDPLPYDEFTKLMSLASVVLTDSGGIQEEAPALGKPVLVMRNNTERPEAVESGTVRLVGTSVQTIIAETNRLLTDPDAYRDMAQATNPYGDGNASFRIVQAIANYLLGDDRPAPFHPCGQETSG